MSKVTISIKKKQKKRNILEEETNQKEKKKEESKPKKITTIKQDDLEIKSNQQKEIQPIPLPKESQHTTSLQQMLNRKKNEEKKQMIDEQTENDYETISIDDFGLAMLKGMGFTGNLS